jgi:hypothetical protein
VFTTDELRQFIADSLGRQSAIFACTTAEGKKQNGIYADVFPEGPMSYEEYIAYTSTPELRNMAFDSVSIDVLGRNTSDIVPSFKGVYGDVVARFKLPGGIDPAQSEGILVHMHLNGEHRFLPLIVSYVPVVLPQGSTIIISGNGTEVIQTSQDLTITPIRSGLLPNSDGSGNLQPADVQAMVGGRIHARHDFGIYPQDHVYLSLFPYGLGIQNTSVIEVIPPEWGAMFSEPIVPFP